MKSTQQTETYLGKIEAVKFGHVGYQEAMLGLSLCFSCNNFNIRKSYCAWDAEMVKNKQQTNWTERDRDDAYAGIMREISRILNDAKVDCISKLVGVPVEVTISKNGTLSSWRVLTEVL